MMPGSAEWLVILGVALLIFGPNKLPKLGGAIGESIRNFKNGMKGLHDDLEESHSKELTKKDSGKADDKSLLS